MPFKSEKQRRWMHANEPAMADKWEEKEKQNEEDELAEKQLGEKKMRVTKSQLKRMIVEMMEDEVEIAKVEIANMSNNDLLQAYYKDLTAETDHDYVQALEDELYNRGIWESTKRKGKLVKESAPAPMRSRAHPEFAKAIKGKLNESLQSVQENLTNAIDEYIQVSDEVQGYDIPLDRLKGEVMNIVDGAFEQLERDQAQDAVYS
jgi:hypothetical protein